MKKDKEIDALTEKEFNFENARKNPYAKVLKKQITLNVNIDSIEYFKEEAERTGYACKNALAQWKEATIVVARELATMETIVVENGL